MQVQKNFIVKGRNVAFACVNCGLKVRPHVSSVRNHCPECLWSVHVDEVVPGDRRASCHGRMQPMGYALTRDGHDLEHHCQKCDKKSINRSAPDDNVDALISLPAVTRTTK